MTRRDKTWLTVANHDEGGDHALHVYTDPDGRVVVHTTGKPIHLSAANVADLLDHLAALTAGTREVVV